MNFSTVGQINLQSGDELPWEFEIPAASSATEKGAIPYNTTVSSVVVTAYDEDGNDVTTEMITGTPTVSDNLITAIIKYPATTGDGRYKLTFACTLNTGRTKQFDFTRVVCKNL